MTADYDLIRQSFDVILDKCIEIDKENLKYEVAVYLLHDGTVDWFMPDQDVDGIYVLSIDNEHTERDPDSVYEEWLAREMFTEKIEAQIEELKLWEV